MSSKKRKIAWTRFTYQKAGRVESYASHHIRGRARRIVIWPADDDSWMTEFISRGTVVGAYMLPTLEKAFAFARSHRGNKNYWEAR